MDPEYLMLALFAAKEIIALIQAGQTLTEEQIAAIIMVNGSKIDAIVPVIRAEMAKYGVAPMA